MGKQNEQAGEIKKTNYSRGIVNLPPRPPRTDEEIQQAMEELHDAQFDPNVMHVGRRGNIVIPMDYE